MVNFPQFCLKTLENFLNFKKYTKIALQVLQGYFGYFRCKMYFDHFEVLRDALVIL